MNIEPKEAFPYKPPTIEIKNKYKHIFDLENPLPSRILKTLFDKFIALILISFSTPILIILKICFVIEGLIVPENKGPMFFYYNAISNGKEFKKYKIRIIKMKYIDPEGAKKGDWIAYSAEWNDHSKTYMGTVVKNFYLDEIPQFFSVLKGEMSIVGPRPLSVIHTERDAEQGNVTRKLIKGGLLGLGHINKGTSEMGNPIYEYEYIDKYMNASDFELLFLDLKIIYKGILLIFKGEGYWYRL